jgi:S-adenosylmethionine:tRNA ribosyltransferase-isomerase
VTSQSDSPTLGSRVSHYEYDLPPGRVALYPADRRERSRLLVVDRGGSPLRHLSFADIPSLPASGDVLVINESRVLPVRLLGRKPTGAPSEVFLLRPAGGAYHEEGAGGGLGKSWEALVRPGGKLKPGRRVVVSPDLEIEILDSTPEGGRVVRLVTELGVEEALGLHGHMPLPPYIDREDEPLDRERYQTVYARDPGSVAAPTAGLHFTEALLDELALRGVGVFRVSLHVGVGTFRPVEVDDPADHTMHREVYSVPADTAEAVNRCRMEGAKVWAVGTTVVRTLETATHEDGRVRPGSGGTRLFIRPPYRYQTVDRLVTNFHLPRSTLLMLVAAFAGYERTMNAYQTAIEEGYRFYSYGDAMAVL